MEEDNGVETEIKEGIASSGYKRIDGAEAFTYGFPFHHIIISILFLFYVFKHSNKIICNMIL